MSLKEELALIIGTLVGMYQSDDTLTVAAIKTTAANFLRGRGIKPDENDYARINQYIERAVKLYKKHFQL